MITDWKFKRIVIAPPMFFVQCLISTFNIYRITIRIKKSFALSFWHKNLQNHI